MTASPLRSRTPLSEAAKRSLAALKRALPSNEWEAVSSWLTTFFPFQLEWILDLGRFSLLVKSRRIGGSHSYAAAVALWAVLGEETTIVSKTGADSDEVREKVVKHLKVLVRLGSNWAKPLVRPHLGHYTERIETSSGGVVRAMSSESGGRGFSGNIVLDEFAYHEHQDEVLDAALPIVFHAGRFRLLSTPNGEGDRFHGMVTEPKRRPGYAVHATTLTQARAQGMVVSDADVESMTLGDPRLYEQLFNCSFLSGDQQYIPTDLIRAAAVDERSMSRIEGFAYAGLDIGLVNDLTSLTVIKQDAFGRMYEQETRTCKRTSWEDQEALVLAAHDDWDFRRLCVDRTGLGRVPSERLEKLLGPHRVESVDFTLESKDRMATGLFQAFNNRTLQIRDDADLIRDLCSMRRIITSAGNIRYDTPRTVHGHGDRAWSLALAVMACSPYVEGRPGTRTDYGDGDYQNT